MVYQWIRETAKQNTGWAATCRQLNLEPNTLVYSRDPQNKSFPDYVQLYFDKDLRIKVPSIYLTRYFHFIGPVKSLVKEDLKRYL